MPVYECHCPERRTVFDALMRAGGTLNWPQCGNASPDRLLCVPLVLSSQTDRLAWMMKERTGKSEGAQ